ncbi:YWFCY domain-containing protein [Sphingobacterium daejeonense]|uniref:YWFCY domain-containing protein n=1 Tax=Sphingobacterium daejeonense TaxID=371142 RepID=UPI003D310273
MHLYWFCYGFFLERGWTLEVINKILGNFDRTAGLFSHTLYTTISCLCMFRFCSFMKISYTNISLARRCV